MPSLPFRLKVQQLDQICLFELTWGQGQQLVATLNYPALLTERYQDWRRIYLSFYKTIDLSLRPTDPDPSESALRGWTIAGGQLNPAPMDWHSKLVEAETRLLKEFHGWLRSAELFEIRATIARASQEAAMSDCPERHSVDVFLTCMPLDLARFPWEEWEIGADVAAMRTIRLIRAPAVIRAPVTSSMRAVSRMRQRGKARILAILGDETGLDFQTDRAAVRSLARMAEITFVGWQPEQPATDVKEKIQQAIANEQGWDVLFFAGHSNETEITGGELAIAPGVFITIRDIKPQLLAAKERGLQVAIFNSCSGLNIAESLIDLGFSQVAVMREPIHNQVAQAFLVQFLRSLADDKDVYESLLAACQFLRLKKNLTYPSAYLVPSLFCHPGAALYRIPPAWRWRRYLQQLLPTRREAIALAATGALSLIAPIQSALLDTRIWMQALYRNYTEQVPLVAEPPPVALVQIDTASISRSGISKVHPIDRRYLAQIVDRLTELNTPLIGLDFVLDTPQAQDKALAKAIQTAVAQNGTWFVFAAILDASSGEIGVNPATGIASPNWSLQGHIDADPRYVMLPYPNEDCRQICPFAHLLALVHTAHRDPPDVPLPQPQLNSPHNLRLHFLNTIDADRSPTHPLTALRTLHLSPISVWAYDQWGQHWLEPIIDFSIPADRVYDRIPAWKLLETDQVDAKRLSQQIVLIAPGNDERMGLSPGKPDRFPIPAALRYWNSQYWLTGSESLAYMMYHQLTQRLVMPIPDLWMVAAIALLGKSVSLWLNNQPNQQQWTRQHYRVYLAGLAGFTTFYGLVSLQLYISASLLLPWFLPSALLWVYLLPALRSSTSA